MRGHNSEGRVFEISVPRALRFLLNLNFNLLGLGTSKVLVEETIECQLLQIPLVAATLPILGVGSATRVWQLQRSRRNTPSRETRLTEGSKP